MSKKSAAKVAMDQAMMGNPMELSWMEDPTEATEAEAAKAKKAEDPMVVLQTQIAELKGQIAGMNAAHQSRTVPLPNVRPNLNTEPDLSNLPNPITDPEGYGKTLHERYQAARRNQKALEQWEATRQSEVKSTHTKLMTQFKTKHPEFAKSEKLIDVFAEEAAKDAEARRLDLNQYMFGNTDQFFSDIVGKMKEAGLGAAPEEGDDNDNEPLNRAMGMPDGGSPAGPGKGIKPAPNAIPVGSITEAMGKWQQQTGFHL